ncbi:substrate-binding periplasmic protein [Pelagibacterium luteolum]|uniref:Cystine transport system substrate-binding protein n=1 Tax=Pelagibacterium luteolum TaxID=440168 RepID=A0A1G7UPG7_9HYPH|nr:transporter substrate-binding domain-containing protein [Pelagibacterium luteolum]SDG48610.1 cystine transport system substrate-binding protein [Pelagibacterium luteolum]
MVERPSRFRSVLNDFGPLAVVFALLFAVSFLPPDTSRAEIDTRGRLSVCMPTSYPPLVTGDADVPGFEVELLQAIADRLGWRLNVVSNSLMGRDYNPRSWRINRAQCQLLAGGVALSAQTRSFLDTSAPHLRTGWAVVSPLGDTAGIADRTVGVYVGLTGLDRIALSQYLRSQQVSTAILRDPAAMARALEDGEVDVVVTEALLATQTFDPDAYEIALLPAPLEQIPLGYGFWKGDMTLRRAVESTLHDLTDEGVVASLAERYEIDPDLLTLGH